MLPHRTFSRLILLPNAHRRFLQQQRGKIVKERIQPHQLIQNIIENKCIKSPKDWKVIRSEILNADRHITSANIDAMTIGVCTNMKKYDLALSYLDYLKEESVTINLATLGKCFKLLYLQESEQSSNNNEVKILSLYNSVRKLHPILDSITLDNIIPAMSITKKWKLTVSLLEEIKVSTTPSSSAYSAVISAAFLNGDDDLAWKLMNEVLDNNRVILENVYVSYLKKKSKNLKDIEKMFQFMQQNSIQMDSNTMDVFIELLKDLKLKVKTSAIYAKGICKCCNKKLKSFELTDEEFNNLKTTMLKNVIVGKDLFNKTSPEELSRFNNFIANIPKFDVIIDGLNVAYSTGVKQSTQITSGLVVAVLSHFTSQGKKVLICGRKHMTKWPKENWNYIQANSTFFLTENLSQDDPYLLYCALNSGKETIIITRDLMRSHKFLLKDYRLKILFDRWLAQRQWFLIRVQDRGIPVFKKPLPFTQIAQEVDGYWHLPFSPKTNSATVNWLCIKLT